MLVLFFVIIGIYVFTHLKKNATISLVEVARISSAIELSGDWWFIVRDADDTKLVEYSIPIDGIDFSKHNLVISNGRKIDRMSFVRSHNFPYRLTHFAEVTFGKEQQDHTWIVYKLSKMDVYMDERFNHGNIE